MRGSGSLSAGSARDRTQLDNAQRAFISPPQSDTHSRYLILIKLSQAKEICVIFLWF